MPSGTHIPQFYSTVFVAKVTVELESAIHIEEEYIQFYGVVMRWGYSINNLSPQKHFQLLNNMPYAVFFSFLSASEIKPLSLTALKRNTVFCKKLLFQYFPFIPPPDCFTVCMNILSAKLELSLHQYLTFKPVDN